MPLPVAIQSTADSPPAMVAAAVDACTRALGRCREGQAEPGEVAASLRWIDGKRLGLSVSVDLPAGKRERTLQFSPTDPEIERWRTAGITVALLAAEAPDPPPPASASAPAPLPTAPSPPAAPPDPPPAPPPRLPIRGSLGAAVTAGIEGRPVGGGELRLSAGKFAAAIGATWPSRTSGVSEQLTWLSLGVATPPLRGGWVNLAGRLEALVERLDAEMDEGEVHDGRYRWLGGGRLGFDAMAPLGRGVGVGATIEAGARWGKTRIFRNGQPIGELRVFRPGGSLWVGYSF